jgi:hypothetical protein
MRKNKLIIVDKVHDSLPPIKPKRFPGSIRERSWKLKDGTITKAWRADAGIINGKRTTKQFDTKVAAENWLWEMSLLVKTQGHDALRLSARDREDAVRAINLLKDHAELPDTGRLESIAEAYHKHRAMLQESNASVTDAIEYFLKMRPSDVTHRITVVEAISQNMQDARSRGLRESTLKDMSLHLAHFAKFHGEKLVTEVTREQAKQYIRTIPGSPRTRSAYQRYAHGLFSYCIDEGYIAEGTNPFASRRSRRLSDGRQDEKMPEFFVPEQALAILRTAQDEAPAILRVYAHRKYVK